MREGRILLVGLLVAFAIGLGLFLVLSPREERAPDTVAMAPDSDESTSDPEAPAEGAPDQAAPDSGANEGQVDAEQMDVAQPASPAPNSETKTQTGPESQAESESPAGSESQADNESQAGAGTQTHANTDTDTDPAPDAAAETVIAQPDAQREAVPDDGQTAEPVAETATSEADEAPELSRDSNTDGTGPAMAERTSETEAALQMPGTARAAREETRAEPLPEPDTESEPVAKSEPDTESAPVAESEPDTESEPVAESESAAEAGAGTDSKADSAPKPSQPLESPGGSEATPESGAPDEAPKTSDVAAEPDAEGPSFDIVRVEPGGAAVIAGRAEPDSQVTVLEDGKPIGDAKANPRGQFVVLPGRSLKTGRSELTLESTSSSGETRESASAVVLATPERPKRENGAASQADRDGDAGTGGEASPSSGEGDVPPGPERPFALKVPRAGSGGAEVLQHPGPDVELETEAKAETETPPAPRLAIRVVQYTNRGGLVVTGVARPGREVAAKLDGDSIGQGRAQPGSGRWSIIHQERIAAGLYTLSVTARNAQGEVVKEVRTPFASQPKVSDLDGERLVVVQPGSNLWTVARRTYGEGVQYTTIYAANEDQIEDPDLIYPGQVFVLPERAVAQ